MFLDELTQHVWLAVQESQADDEGEVCEAPENAEYLERESQVQEAECGHDCVQPQTELGVKHNYYICLFSTRGARAGLDWTVNF